MSRTWDDTPPERTEASYMATGTYLGIITGLCVGMASSWSFFVIIALGLLGLPCGAWVGYRMWWAKVKRESTWSGTRRVRDERGRVE